MRTSQARQTAGRFGSFVRDYTAGMSTQELRRLFDRDAARAWEVLTREHAPEGVPARGLRLCLLRVKLAFLGLSYKLSPARRALFALSLLAAVLALFSFQVGAGSAHVDVNFAPLWFLTAVGGLVFLLALELVDRVRVRDELQVARELQADLLPRELPEVPGYRFAHSYRTANEVGGDYYDVTPLPDGRVALLVGDASGHGMAAGLVMAIANATIETALDLDPSPERVLALLNRTLCRTGTRRTFMSLFYALLEPATGRLEYVCAGHPFPLLRRAGGAVEELGSGGLPLGMREPLPVESATTTLSPGDLLLFFTDGLAEATGGEGGAAFGFDRLGRLVQAGGTPLMVHDRIRAAFAEHVGDEPLKDDLTLLVVGRDVPLPPLPNVPPPPASAPAE